MYGISITYISLIFMVHVNHKYSGPMDAVGNFTNFKTGHWKMFPQKFFEVIGPPTTCRVNPCCFKKYGGCDLFLGNYRLFGALLFFGKVFPPKFHIEALNHGFQKDFPFSCRDFFSGSIHGTFRGCRLFFLGGGCIFIHCCNHFSHQLWLRDFPSSTCFSWQLSPKLI